MRKDNISFMLMNLTMAIVLKTIVLVCPDSNKLSFADRKYQVSVACLLKLA